MPALPPPLSPAAAAPADPTRSRAPPAPRPPPREPALQGGARHGRAPDQRPLRIAVLFFGITRSLRFTLPSIEANVLAPVRLAGQTRIFAHFFDQSRIDNPRTGEALEVDPVEYRLLAPDGVELEPPEACLAGWDYDRIAAAGDTWHDGHKSVRNLVHQLHSLNRVTALATPWSPDLWVYVRPDLRYHDSLAPILARAAAGPDETVWVPLWLWRGGLNDRFAVIRGARAAQAYGTRATRMHDFCAATGGPLHAERLLRFALADTPVRRIATRATRIRANGAESWESFSFDALETLHNRLEAGGAPQLAKRIGHRSLRETQRLLDLFYPR